jgi:RNA polymerase sigma factor (sigma-70 family)
MVVNHDDTDDLVQDVFIKVWKNLDHFRNDSQLYTWIYRIATNESITFLNKQKQKNNTPLDEVSSELAESLVEPSYFNGNDIQLKLQRAVLTLPEKQRLIFNMKYFDDLKRSPRFLEPPLARLKPHSTLRLKKLKLSC